MFFVGFRQVDEEDSKDNMMMQATREPELDGDD